MNQDALTSMPVVSRSAVCSLFCGQPSTAADTATDENGVTRFTAPLWLGAHSLYPGDPVQVIVAGTGLTQEDLPISYNSPDINGDCQVNLTDLGLFAYAYTGGTGD